VSSTFLVVWGIPHRKRLTIPTCEQVGGEVAKTTHARLCDEITFAPAKSVRSSSWRRLSKFKASNWNFRLIDSECGDCDSTGMESQIL
jgi:hypothetical protein